MVWHEGYHHGQIEVALEVVGLLMSDDEAGPRTRNVWMVETRGTFERTETP
jgi:hypothetical protein